MWYICASGKWAFMRDNSKNTRSDADDARGGIAALRLWHTLASANEKICTHLAIVLAGPIWGNLFDTCFKLKVNLSLL